MQSKKLAAVGILVAICACGGTSASPDAGNANFALTVKVSGAGSVTSPDGSISCATAACTHSIAAGTAVTYTITHFDDAGAIVGTPGTFTGTDCLVAGATAAVDTNDNTLVEYATGTSGAFGISVGSNAMRWSDAGGAPRTDWFDGAGGGSLHPLLGGQHARHRGTGRDLVRAAHQRCLARATPSPSARTAP